MFFFLTRLFSLASLSEEFSINSTQLIIFNTLTESAFGGALIIRLLILYNRLVKQN